MALTLEQLQAQRDEILARMGDATRVDIGEGRGVTYPTQPELEAALAKIDAQIVQVQQSSQSRQFTVRTSRGL